MESAGKELEETYHTFQPSLSKKNILRVSATWISNAQHTDNALRFLLSGLPDVHYL
jgi:hypothetical protein